MTVTGLFAVTVIVPRAIMVRVVVVSVTRSYDRVSLPLFGYLTWLLRRPQQQHGIGPGGIVMF